MRLNDRARRFAVRVHGLVLCGLGVHQWNYKAFRCCSEHYHVERVCRRCGREDVWLNTRWSARDRLYWAAENGGISCRRNEGEN